MRTAARKTVRYSLIFLALVVTLLVAAPFFIDANQYKSLIVDQGEKAIGRHIEIGELHASLFPWVGVRIDDVHIANPKGFAAGDVLQVKSLDVQVAVLPLLGGSYQIERFVLDTPRVQLSRSADGFSNWEDLLPAAEQATDKSGHAPQPSRVAAPAKADKQTGGILAALSAQSLSMNDGELHFVDAQSGRNIHLTALNIEVEDVQLQRPVSLRASGKLDGDAFALDMMLGPVGDIAALDSARLPFTGHLSVPAAGLGHLSVLAPELQALGEGTLGLDMQLEQRPNGVRVMVGSLKLHAAHDLALDVKAQMPDAEHMQIEQLLASLDTVELANINGTVKGIGGKLLYQFRVNTPELTRMQLSQWLPELEGMYAAHPDPWKTIKLGVLAAGDTEQVDIRDLQLLLGDDLLQVSGNINFAAAPDIRLRIASRLLHADPWLPQPASADDSGEPTAADAPPTASTLPDGMTLLPVAHAKAPDESGATGPSDTDVEEKAVEPDLRFLKAWKISTILQVDRLLFRGLDISRLRADVNGNNGVIRMNPIRFELAGGSVEEKASLNAGKYPASWSEAVKVHDVQIQPILKALADNDLLSGRLEMNTHLGGQGLLPEAAVARLNGKGNLLLRDGSIKGLDIPGTLRNIKSLGQGGGERKSTDFSQLSGSFNVTNGVARNDDLFMASPLFRLTGYGVVNLVMKQMDYHLKPRLVGALVGQGDSEAVRKGLEVPLRLIGPLDAPQVKLEVSLKSLLGNREAITNIIKNRKSIVKGLLNGGGAGSTAQPSDNQGGQQNKPQPPINQMLKNLLPGL